MAESYDDLRGRAGRKALIQQCEASLWSPIIGFAIEYSLLERTVEGELIPMAQSFGMGVRGFADAGSERVVVLNLENDAMKAMSYAGRACRIAWTSRISFIATAKELIAAMSRLYLAALRLMCSLRSTTARQCFRGPMGFANTC